MIGALSPGGPAAARFLALTLRLGSGNPPASSTGPLTETVTPLKPLEAMAQGRLLVASNVGGHRELIEDGGTGYLFEPGDPAALAAAIQRVIREAGRLDAVRAAGRRFVESERNWRTSVARYASVYAAARGQAAA